MGAREALRAGIKAFSIYLAVQLVLMFFSFLASRVSTNPLIGTITVVLMFVNLVMMFVNAARWYSQAKDVNRLFSRTDVKGLIRLLDNQSLDWRIRRDAAQALEDIGPGAREAVPTLIETLRKEHVPNVLEGAASALGGIDQASLIDEWNRMLQLDRLPSDPDGWGDYWAIRRALVSMGPGAVPRLKAGLRDEKEAVRKHAAGILGDIGRDAIEAAPDLILALEDESDGVRGEAAIALSRMGKEAVPLLVKELSHEKLDARLCAIRALCGMGSGAKDAVPALIQSLREEDWGVREKAAEALGNIGPDAEASLPALKKALREVFESREYESTSRSRKLLLLLAKAVGRIAPDAETILFLSRRFCESERWDEKEAILVSLGEFGQAVMRPEVLETLDIYAGITGFIDDQYYYMEDELVGRYRVPEEVMEALKKMGYHYTRLGI